MYKWHQWIVLFLSFPATLSVCCVYANCDIIREKECMSNEQAQSDSWIAVEQATIDV